MSSITVKTGISQRNLTIADGRKYFWQWDTGCQLLATGYSDDSTFHYYRQGMNEPLSLKVYKSNAGLVCDVPDELLQNAVEFVVYVHLHEEDGSHTVTEKKFVVKPRPKPSEYIYTEPELFNYNSLEKRIEELEKNGGGGGGGAAGENGATFIPEVSARGIISWTNDKGLPNPSPVNIKGPKGDKGDPYIFTDEDKQEIVTLVLAEIPDGDEVEY